MLNWRIWHMEHWLSFSPHSSCTLGILLLDTTSTAIFGSLIMSLCRCKFTARVCTGIPMFWTANTFANSKLPSIIIYYNLELTSKCRLNIFQLSVREISEYNLWDNLGYIPLVSDSFLSQSKEHSDYLGSQLYFNKWLSVV